MIDSVNQWLDELLKDQQKPLLLVSVAMACLVVHMWASQRGGLVKAIKDTLFASVANIPLVQAKVNEEKEKTLHGMKEEMTGPVQGLEEIKTLPKKGLSARKVQALLTEHSDVDTKVWNHGKVSGCVYYGHDDADKISQVVQSAMQQFALSNPLHPDVFPSVRKMEAEVVSMVLDLFNGRDAESGRGDACGCMTSGGTESILMACKAYRDMGRERKGITMPEIVAPKTAHAAFDKAANYFGIKLISVPVDPVTMRADPDRMEAAITSNTVAVVASACQYPHGCLDPVVEIAARSKAKGVPVHVDSCLGSFVIACAEAAGKKLPPCDFRVPGVTSISCDTHKYGYAPKGSSVIMYSNKQVRSYQYFTCLTWPGGLYASPSIAGSRIGATVAATWAVMSAMGKDGYVQAARNIFDAVDVVAEAVREQEGIELYGSPDLSVVCFGEARSGARRAHPLNVMDKLKTRGWNLNGLQDPPCVHLCVTAKNAPLAAEFARDLKWATELVLSEPEGNRGSSLAIYGMSKSAPEAVIGQITHGYLDLLTET